MRNTYQPRLKRRQRYLQVALNSTLDDARHIISQLPVSDRIIIEAGTPLIKRYGMDGIRRIRSWYEQRLSGTTSGASFSNPSWSSYFAGNDTDAAMKMLTDLFVGKKTSAVKSAAPSTSPAHGDIVPYVVADMKTMDRGQTEVEMVAQAGASAAVALGSAPVETLNSFVAACEANGIDAMIDMMNVEYPLHVLRQMRQVPPVVILHRGVDEERDNREKQIPLHEIRRIKGSFDIMISIAGGDTQREVQRAVFNDADIVVIWKSVYTNTKETLELVAGFLKDIK